MFRILDMTSNLPVDLWAQVARFIAPSDRGGVFWALRKALLIPTHGTLHETMLRFLKVAYREESKECTGSWPVRCEWNAEYAYILTEMGFEEDAVTNALLANNCVFESALYDLFLSA